MTDERPYGEQRLAADADLRRSRGGRTLIGGSPLRLLRLSDAGASLVTRWFDGEQVGGSSGARSLAHRLVHNGMAHPVVTAGPADARDLARVTVVVPAFNNADSLDTALASLGTVVDMIIVDDASAYSEAQHLVTVAERYGARLLVRPSNGGPGAARNTGWQEAATEFVAFVDADVVASKDWLGPIMTHLEDPEVAAVAPRVVSAGGASAHPAAGGEIETGHKNVGPRPTETTDPAGNSDPTATFDNHAATGLRDTDATSQTRPPALARATLLERYEAARSPLDMGTRPGRVAPRTRISYVPTAALVVRRQVLKELDGFDETMRVGEDVDLVWRMTRAGHQVRYEPKAVVSHRPRGSWRDVVHQRRSYGTAAADLETRHPEMVTPVEVNGWSLVSWALIAGGGRRGPVAGVATAVVSAAGLVPKLAERVDDPVGEAARLGGLGHLHAGRWLAAAATRAWLPGMAVGAVVSRSMRRATAAAIVIPALTDWAKERPDIDPIRWTALRFLDDASYCAGVWQGVVRHRSLAALKPKLTNIKGLNRG